MRPFRRRALLLPIVLGLLASVAAGGCGRGGREVPAPIVAGNAVASPDAGQPGNDASHPADLRRANAARAALLSDGEFARRDAVRAEVRAWAESDLNGALAWAQNLPEGDLREAALRVLGPMLAALDFTRALALSADFRPGASRDEYVGEAAQAWVGHGGDPRAAERWARGMSDVALREKVLSAIAVQLAQDAPAEAAALVARAFAPGPQQDAAAVTVAMRWAASDPAAATDWAARQPAGSSRDALLRATVGRWAEADAVAVSDWINSLPAGPLREEVTDGYLGVWADAAPARALDWAVANGRDTRLANIVHRWYAARPEEARAWVAAAALPDTEKYHLLYDNPREERHDPR